jgi:hypothetical protein
LSKNTRWALAIVGVLIIVVAAVVIGTGSEEQSATPSNPDKGETSRQHESTGDTGATGMTGATGTKEHETQTDDNTGGAAPDASSDDNTGGAGPQEQSGGAKIQTGVVTPVLTPEKPRKIKVGKGETVVIRARSSMASTLHVHGYDLTLALKAGRTGQLKFVAKIDGEFAIEFHYPGSEASAGTLLVNP